MALALPELVLIKLGGSLITDKCRSNTTRDDVLRRVAEEIASVLSGPSFADKKVVVGHGSGSFGHVAAEAHGFNKCVSNEKEMKGAAFTQDAATQLHRHVVAALLEAGLAPFSIAPSSCFIAEEGNPIALTLEPLEAALSLGMIPVIFGDVVMDRKNGACVLSTENVFLGLCGTKGVQRYKIRRSIWLGVTAGVYDANGKTIPVLSRKSLAKFCDNIGPAQGTDVTGGMHHRVDAALELADLGVQSLICDGTTPGVLGDALLERNVVGTVVDTV